MTTDTIAIQKEQPWSAGTSSGQSLAYWRGAQYALLLLGMALLATLYLRPELGCVLHPKPATQNDLKPTSEYDPNPPLITMPSGPPNPIAKPPLNTI